MSPRNTRPLRSTFLIATGSPVRLGAGSPRFMLRALHGSRSAGQAERTNGQPSCTMSADSFHEPAAALTSRNSSGVTTPSTSAFSPYWTPTLSQVERA